MAARGGGELIILPYEDAIKAIAERASKGQRLENWEGWIRHRDGTRAKSLAVSGSFALSRDPARAAEKATADIQRAHAAWQRNPDYPDAQLLLGLTFGQAEATQ